MPKKKERKARRLSIGTIPPSPTKARIDKIEATMAKLKSKRDTEKAPVKEETKEKKVPVTEKPATEKPKEVPAKEEAPKEKAVSETPKKPAKKVSKPVPAKETSAPPTAKEEPSAETPAEPANEPAEASPTKEAGTSAKNESILGAVKAAKLAMRREVRSVPTGTIKAPVEKKAKIFKEYKEEHAGSLAKAKPETKQKSRFARVPSGIPGLDQLIAGGFKKGSTVLVTGGPGSGKTTFLLQYLYEGALQGEGGLFISFEEDEHEIIEDYSTFNWDLEDMIKKKKLLFLKYPPHQVEKIMEQGGGMIKDMIKDAKITRVGIDSLTSFSLLFKDEYEKREKILKFFDILAEWGCTVLLTSERTTTLEDAHSDFGLEFLVDGAVILYNVRKGNVREQAVEVMKMRATNIKKKICPITITAEGIQVFPDAEVFTEI